MIGLPSSVSAPPPTSPHPDPAHTFKYTSSSEDLLFTPLQSCSSNWGCQLHYPHHGICDHTWVHKDSSLWSLKLKLRENKHLALKSASWTKQVTRNNFSQNVKSEETRAVVPDPGSKCYLSQSVLLPSLTCSLLVESEILPLAKKPSILQQKQHPLSHWILPTTVCSRNYLYFRDEEPEAQNSQETCPRRPIR